MKWKLNNFFPQDETCLEAILAARGVENVDDYLHPSPECEIHYSWLDNIAEGIAMLAKHLDNKNKVLFLVDCD